MPLAVVHLDDQSFINDNSCIIEYDCKLITIYSVYCHEHEFDDYVCVVEHGHN